LSGTLSALDDEEVREGVMVAGKPEGAHANEGAPFILNLACLPFAEESYENVGLCEIAADERIDVALTARVFLGANRNGLPGCSAA
jgi:hypothetical protein